MIQTAILNAAAGATLVAAVANKKYQVCELFVIGAAAGTFTLVIGATTVTRVKFAAAGIGVVIPFNPERNWQGAINQAITFTTDVQVDGHVVYKDVTV